MWPGVGFTGARHVLLEVGGVGGEEAVVVKGRSKSVVVCPMFLYMLLLGKSSGRKLRRASSHSGSRIERVNKGHVTQLGHEREVGGNWGSRRLETLEIGRRKRRRPTVGGRGETGTRVRVENSELRDIKRTCRVKPTGGGRGGRLLWEEEENARKRGARDREGDETCRTTITTTTTKTTIVCLLYVQFYI